MYEKYKVIKDKETFFKEWDSCDVTQLSEDLKEIIYQKYFIKCLVFQKANFKCENEGCDNETNLTLHHIKFQKNGGKNSVKNGSCICKSCHKAFHQSKGDLVIDGATYRVHKEPNSIDWKVIRKETKVLRKDNKRFHGIKISWELIVMLMKFLDINYNEEMEDNVDGEDD